MPNLDPTPLDAMLARLDRLLAGSPADSTEATWIELRRGAAASGERGRRPAPAGRAGTAADPAAPGWERTLILRVRQSGRTGLHRTGIGEPSEIENALRDALAQARLAPPSDALPLPGPGDGGAASATGGEHAWHDPALAALSPGSAAALLDGCGAARGEHLRLSWVEGRVAVANSAGLRRAVQATAAACTAAGGEGGGRADAAARHLDALDIAALLDRARRRGAGAGTASAAPPAAGSPLASAAPGADPAPSAGEPAASGVALALSEQAAAALVDLLNRHALAADAFRDPASWLHGRLGEALCAPAVHLCDDATGPLALPFPFDLAGWPKRPVEMIAAGVFLSPAVDPLLAPAIGLPPTPHALGPDEWLAANLVLAAAPGGGLGEADLLAHAEGGLWIGALDRVQCFDPRRLRFRAVARGVRRIAGGALGTALPDLLWEDTLPAVLAAVRALGDRPVAVAAGELLFGAIAAPLLACGASGSATFRVVGES